MADYVSDAQVSADWFDDEDVTDTNVISAARHARLKSRATNEINRVLGVTVNVTDVNNELAEIASYLYGKGLDGFPTKLSRNNLEEADMIADIQCHFGTIPFRAYDPQSASLNVEKIGYHDDMG